MGNVIAELQNINKVFPGVIALNNASIQLRAGEIHGLIGENGAGKSTLIKVLTGLYQPDGGKIFLDGKPVRFKDPLDAKRRGVSCVYQELNIVKLMSLTDNLFPSDHIKKGKIFLDYAGMNDKAREVMSTMGQDVDPTLPSGIMGMGMQQMVEIGKAVLQNARVLILDEPTSSLGKRETEDLFRTIRMFKEQGLAILFVSHKIEELFTLCDVITIMRDSKIIATDTADRFTPDDLITQMVGRKLENLYPKTPAAIGDTVLEVKNLSSVGVFQNVSFRAKRGEILAFSGLVGAGRTEVARAIFGADPVDAGEVLVNGESLTLGDPAKAIEKGIALLTEDRKSQGLILMHSVKDNLSVITNKKQRKGLFLDTRRIEKEAEDTIRRLNIKTPKLDTKVTDLSGGNQQKVVIGKWINTNGSIFIFDEPTKGIDVGAKIEVYRIICQLVGEGKSVIMISSELPEILSMADRVIVMRSGRIMAEIERGTKHFNQESIMKAAWGGELEYD